ncbi:unnamed protein product [Psylliodes chrysocephalus]|uniref:Uncharacterized protein n=1 Tax=Psylliodes chrysocephalus TaxID=3402493 RepID=A0A9P0G924_9CUCU|nr:unnamed protein product [Psylliodes chrysocephala]
MILLIWCLLLFDFNFGANVFNCPTADIKFEKTLGLRPPNSSHPEILYQLQKNTPLRPVTSECIAKCQSNNECASFVLYYSVSRCYWFKHKENNFTDDSENVIDDNAAWFVKKCFLTGRTCDKFWNFERIPGAILIGNDTKQLPGAISRTDCEQYCLNETQFICRSAKFIITDTGHTPSDNGGYSYGPHNNELLPPESNSGVKGTCTLSNADRHQMPFSYRVSSYGDEYFENQCAPNAVSSNEFCAYEEYDNTTLAHSDILFEKKTKEECQKLCDQFLHFNCRGYSIIEGKTCYLHSEDSKIYGPNALRFRQGSTYYEKANCLNITVSCTETYMSIEYDPDVNFNGRMYMEGYSEKEICSTIGQGRYHPISLKIPLLTGQCGIIKADGPVNRTLLSGNLLIQFNSLIQTQNDRLIRVGCIFGNETRVVIGTGVQVSPMQPNKGSVIIIPGQNSSVPNVVMKIVDPHKGTEISDTQIGQELRLQIILNPRNNLDIWASHLIAMTERSDESIFLLDDRGCPTELSIFPALTKNITKESIELDGTFQAFKFADSPIVRFSVNIQFCIGECPTINCGHNIISYGRKRRDVKSHNIETINGTTVVKLNTADLKNKSSILFQMPLEYIMVVKHPNKYVSDRLVYADNQKILVAGYDYTTNEVCLDYSLVIALIILWILVQIFFVIGSIVLVRRYKRYYQHECTRQSMEELHKNFGIGFSNLENRRVHWADNENIL